MSVHVFGVRHATTSVRWLLSPLALVACAREPYIVATAATLDGKLTAYGDYVGEVGHDTPEVAARVAEAAREPAFRGQQGYVSAVDALQVLALKQRAARDFACDVSRVSVVRYTAKCVAMADGCGKREVYEWVHSSEFTREAPGFPGKLVFLGVGVFVPIGTPLEDGSGPVSPLAPPPTEEGRFPYTHAVFSCGGDASQPVFAKRMTVINERAARDLGCPRSQVFPIWQPGSKHHPSRAIAEGCGQRVTYDGNDQDLWRAGSFGIERCDDPPCAPSASVSPHEDGKASVRP
jgi:hypothetical protein